MNAFAFCANCGAPRAAGLRFCGSCGRPYQAAAQFQPGARPGAVASGMSALGYVGTVASLGALVWVWVTTGSPDFSTHLVVFVFISVFVIAAIWVVVGVLAALLGALGIAASPFRRR